MHPKGGVKITTHAVLLLLGLLFSYFLSACSDDTNSLLYGQWKQENRNLILEFSEFNHEEMADELPASGIDGKVSVICDHVILEGYYIWLDEENIAFYFSDIKDECFENMPAEQINFTQFLYYVEELSKSSLILQSDLSPNIPTVYKRLN